VVHFKAKDPKALPPLDSLTKTVNNRVFGTLPFRAYRDLLAGRVTNSESVPEGLAPLVDVVDPSKTEPARDPAPMQKAKPKRKATRKA
jgi:hypothetical protein